jgi:tRNA/tmRNA/rRNA uracil-C5-methylase (TrmA/RlmC/RlmD family)
MTRPTKPLSLVQGHRTKAERSVREKAESALLTGISMKESPEVKANPIAHKEFARIKKLLKSIGKDDDLSGHIINTHCILHAECKALEEMKVTISANIKILEEAYQRNEFDALTYISEINKLTGALLASDKKIMDKRKMILDISKESIMTIQSALRSIPKKELKKEPTAMEKFLSKRNGANATQ